MRLRHDAGTAVAVNSALVCTGLGQIWVGWDNFRMGEKCRMSHGLASLTFHNRVTLTATISIHLASTLDVATEVDQKFRYMTTSAAQNDRSMHLYYTPR
jgi:ammonia channel protein AmtB